MRIAIEDEKLTKNTGVIDHECMTYLEYRNGKFLMKEIGEHAFDRRIFRIATNEDI